MNPITPAYIQDQIAKGKKYVLVLKKIGPNREHSEEEANEIHAAHLMHLFTLKEQGIILINGPLFDHPEIKGISIFNSANKEEVLSLANQDPAVIAGRLVNEAYEWFGIPGAVLV
jgi:uncharacterized protein YciI